MAVQAVSDLWVEVCEQQARSAAQELAHHIHSHLFCDSVDSHFQGNHLIASYQECAQCFISTFVQAYNTELQKLSGLQADVCSSIHFNRSNQNSHNNHPLLPNDSAPPTPPSPRFTLNAADASDYSDSGGGNNSKDSQKQHHKTFFRRFSIKGLRKAKVVIRHRIQHI